ncbi:MAG: OB-fold nucleic acid binding domain-containing protein, partial [Planctomycetota bacterium]|nr:OB-fold nucleic acid binding domain-containing protein [Planctomycetota bacterium]
MSETTPQTQQQEGQSGEETHRLEAQRRSNRDAAAALGASPYGQRTDGLMSVAEARRLYDPAADAEHQEKAKDAGHVDRRPSARVAGRVMLHRDTGKLIFIQIRDHTVDPALEDSKDLQIAVSKRDCDEKGFALAKVCDLGDVIVAEGPLMKTRTGE